VDNHADAMDARRYALMHLLKSILRGGNSQPTPFKIVRTGT
jgi:hypothetical protein